MGRTGDGRRRLAPELRDARHREPPRRRVNNRRRLTLGAVLAVAYIGVAVATAGVSGHSVLPLYEGVGSAPPYQWVNPPAAFKTGNVVPKPNTTKVPLGAKGNRDV